MAKKDDKKTELPPFEEWLAPWEADKDGKKLDEPAEIDPERIKKHLYNLLSDKTRLQETVADRDVQLAEKDEALTTLQREHENEDQRKQREAAEREKHYEQLEAKNRERDKVDALLAEFEERGITQTQARKLASRIKGDDEKAWLDDARELVEEGFRIGSPTQGTEQVVEDEPTDGLGVRPIPRRGTGQQSAPKPAKKKSVTEEMEEAGLFSDTW